MLKRGCKRSIGGRVNNTSPTPVVHLNFHPLLKRAKEGFNLKAITVVTRHEQVLFVEELDMSFLSHPHSAHDGK